MSQIEAKAETYQNLMQPMTHDLRAGGTKDAAKAEVRARGRRISAQTRSEHTGNHASVPNAPANESAARTVCACVVLPYAIRGAVPGVYPPSFLCI